MKFGIAMFKVFLFFVLIFSLNLSFVHLTQAQLPPALEQVKREYQKSIGLEAEFEQTTLIQATQQNKKTSGKLWVKKPNMMRWETINPDANLLVSNGKTFWFYTPPFDSSDRGQVIVRKTGQVQTEFLSALINGDFEFKNKKTKIIEKSPREFELIPFAGTAGDVKSAKVFLDVTQKKIVKVSVEHTTGNITEIQLNKLNLSPKLDAKLFNFVPDRNTDQVTE